MEENGTSLQRMNYTEELLKHSKWKSSYRCVCITDNFDLYDGDTIIPVWGTALDADSLINKFSKNITIHVPVYAEVLLGVVGNQYFDVFESLEGEIVVDCGAYDGATELEIAKWTNYTYRKIYAFEPNWGNCQSCIVFYEDNNLQNIELIPKGTWNEDTELSFSAGRDENSAGGKLCQDGGNIVPVTTIDSVVGDDKVTFIKMDVEGAELESLKGAAETIKKNTPRLAICIYHKFEDLWTIPEYILSLNNNYRFYIRHYTSYIYETVLYASINQ